MKIAVLGPGGVGGFLAAALSRAGEDVVVVAREETASVLGERGIEVHSVRLGDFTARPRALSALEHEVDALLIAVKATGLEEALGRVRTPPVLVVPLLNGLDHLALLRARFGAERVAAGVIRVESDRPSVGRIVQRSPFLRVDLFGRGVGPLAQALERAGVPTRIGEGEAQVMWSKLVRLNALALTTSAADRPLGFVRDDPRWRSALEAAVAEGAACAHASGADVDPADTMRELEEAHAALGSSMQRDIAAGRAPELDAIAGAVLRAAARHGIQAPATTWLSERVAARAGIEPPRV